MISKYDPVEQSVRKYEAKLKGKSISNADLSSLSMSLILEKNRQIDKDNKLHKIRVIRGRQLRIKISEVFNQKILQDNSFLVKGFKNRQLMTSSSLSLSHKRDNKPLFSLRQKRRFSYNLPKQSQTDRKNKSKAIISRVQSTQQTGGMINLFQKFSQQEIAQIQSNQEYFLVSSQLIDLFRKYMIKKRMNNKDHSYERFMLRSREQTILQVATMPQEQIKKYIFQRIGMKSRNEDAFKPHLLTNPSSLEFPRTKTEEKIPKVQHHRMPLFLELNRRQQQNEQRLRIQLQKKKKKLRIDICYNEGIAAQVRAIEFDKKKQRLSQLNLLQNRRTIDYRNRIAFINNNYGKSVELAQEIRKEFIKNRKIKQKMHDL